MASDYFVFLYKLSLTDKPGSPTKLKVVDTTKTSVTLGWIKPAYDGGSPVTSYVVEKREGEEQEWTVVSTKGEVRTTEYVVSHLQPSVNYYFRVSAVNSAGQGEPIEMTEPVQAKDILGTVPFSDLLFFCVLAFFQSISYFTFQVYIINF